MKPIKCELFNDNFQNYKRYAIPKAQLVIADIPYNVGNNFYGSNPMWYNGGDNKNGESKLAGKAAFNTDYNFKGVFLIAILYLMRQSTAVQCVGGACSVAWELPAPIAFLPIWLYNGFRGLKMKYFFYWFYPVHLLILSLICIAF